MPSTCVFWVFQCEDLADAKKILQASDFLQQEDLRSWKLVDEEIIYKTQIVCIGILARKMQDERGRDLK